MGLRGTGELGTLHSDKLNGLYSSLNILRLIKSRRMGWVRHIARMGKGEVYTGFCWGKSEGKRPLGRHRRRWKDNIKMEIQEVGCGVVDWIELVQGTDRWRALVNAVMNLRVA